MQISFKNFKMQLEDMPLDAGYASDEVSVKGTDAKKHALGGQNGKTQLIISTPFIDDEFLKELSDINEMLPQGGEHEVTAALVVANDSHKDPEFEKIDFFIDGEGEFGDFYSTRLVGEPYDSELTKSLIIISKDGAIFYDEFLNDLNDKFNQDNLLRKITAAQLCYTGKGCH